MPRHQSEKRRKRDGRDQRPHDNHNAEGQRISRGSSYYPNYDRTFDGPFDPPQTSPNSRTPTQRPINPAPKSAVSRNIPPTQPNVALSENSTQSSARREYAIQMTGNTAIPPSGDLHQDSYKLIETIVALAPSAVKAESSFQKAEELASLHESHTQYQESFAPFFEETRFRASQARQFHLDIEKEKRERQEIAAAAFTSVLKRVHSRVDSSELAGLKTAMQDMKARHSEFQTELNSTKESLEEVRRENKRLKDHVLTEEILDKSLQEISNRYTTCKDHEASKSTLRDLCHRFDNLTTELAKLQQRIDSIPRDVQKWSDHFETSESKVNKMKEDITTQKDEVKNELEELRSSMGKMLDDIRQQSNLGQYHLSQTMDTCQHNITNSEKSFENRLEKLLQTVREEQSASTEVLMQELRKILTTQKGHKQEITTTKKDLKALKDVTENPARYPLQNQNQHLANIVPRQMSSFPQGVTAFLGAAQHLANIAPGQTSSFPQEATTVLGNAQHLATATRPAPISQQPVLAQNNASASDREVLQILKQQIMIQDCKLNDLSSTIAQFSPLHQANLIAQINHLGYDHRILENSVRDLSEQRKSLETRVNDNSEEIRVIGDEVGGLQSSLITLRQKSIDQQGQSATGISQLGEKFEEESNEIKIKHKALASEFASFKNRSLFPNPSAPPPTPPLPPPPPSSLVSHPLPFSRGMPTTGLGQEVPAVLHEDSRPAVEARNHKRQRTASPSSEDDVPLSQRIPQNRQKQIKRMNQSKSGLA